MPRAATFDVAKTVDGVAIYVDLAHLPIEEAKKKSLVRLRNKRSNDKRKGIVVSKPVRGPHPMSVNLPKLPETEAMRARHAKELADMQAAEDALLRAHMKDAENVERLVKLIEEIEKLQNGDKLSKPFREELASLK